VERFFGELTIKLLQRGVHTNIQAREADIRNCIRTHLEREPAPVRLDQDRRRDPRRTLVDIVNEFG
jgi:hypothetical protein